MFISNISQKGNQQVKTVVEEIKLVLEPEKSDLYFWRQFRFFTPCLTDRIILVHKSLFKRLSWYELIIDVK